MKNPEEASPPSNTFGNIEEFSCSSNQDEPDEVEHAELLWPDYECFFEGDELTDVYAAETLERGTKLEWLSTTFNNYYAYPNDTPLHILAIVNNSWFEYRIETVPLYASGCSNSLKFKGLHGWENGRTGEVITEFDGYTIDFLDPFYAYDRIYLKKDKQYKFSLFGIALSCEEEFSSDYELTEGDFYEKKVREYLKEHPGARRKDLPPIKILTDMSTGLYRTDYARLYDCIGFVADVQEFQFFKTKVYKLDTAILRTRDDHVFLSASIYASEKVLGAYIPQKKDRIRCRIDLYGTLLFNGYGFSTLEFSPKGDS